MSAGTLTPQKEFCMNKKLYFWLMFGFILTVGLTFAACDDSSSTSGISQNDFYGVWFASNTYSINANEITVQSGQVNSAWFRISNLTWTKLNNQDDETKEFYPTGYRINGSVSGYNSYVMNIGDPREFIFFMSVDKQSICYFTNSGNIIILEK